MDVLVADKELLAQIEPILYPCLQHTLTLDGLYRTGEGAYMITQVVYHGYRDKKINQAMWNLFPQLLFVCTGKDDQEEGFGFENLNVVTLAMKNYISRDPDGMM